MKIVTWNVNSIKARQDHVVRYLQEQEPDLLMVQELKGLDFPADNFEAIGYKTHAVTQKSYNGVAVFSKHDFDVIRTALEGDTEDEQARFIEIKIAGVHYINIYLPNGNPAPGPKYDYKLAWMERLRTHAAQLIANDTPFLIGGDFNVIPHDRDCHDPKSWADDALKRPPTLEQFRALENLGLYDAFRAHDNRAQQYSFWDYQAGAWQKNNGIRIDHFLLSPDLTDKLVSCAINKEPRGWDKPSDHTPVELELAL